MKPFNLEEALSGKPVRLREGTKAYVKFALKNQFSCLGKLVGFVTYETSHYKDEDFLLKWGARGFICSGEENPEDIIGMWEEPKRVINGIEVPEPVTMEDWVDGAYYWHVHLYCLDFVTKSLFSRKSSGDTQLIKKGFVFKTKEDAQKMAKALLNYKEGKKIEWFNANEKQPELDSKILYYSAENGMGVGIVKEINYNFINDEGKPYKLLLIYDVNDETEFITSAEYWIPVPQPPQA